MKNLLLILFNIVSLAVGAQELPDLGKLISGAKAFYPKVDTLDNISSKLNYFTQHVPTFEQRNKIIEIYKSVSNGYDVNYHFKQGYAAYQKYLSLKEKKLAEEKAAAIGKVKKQYEEQNNNDESEVMNLQSRQQQLNHDIDTLISKRSSFKKIFSLTIPEKEQILNYNNKIYSWSFKYLNNFKQFSNEKIIKTIS